MKILTYKWKAYNQQDIVNNLVKRGHSVDEIRGEMCNFETDTLFMSDFENKITSTKYDMVFTVNYFPMISDICQRFNIPYISWCCDCPLGTMYHESVFNPVNTIFTFDKLNQLEFEAMGANVHYLPLCADVDRVDKLIYEEIEPDKYCADISFVGSMYNKNSFDDICEKLPEYIRGYFEGIMKMQMNIYGDYLLDEMLDSHTLYELNKHFVLAKSDRSFSDLDMVFSSTVLGFKIAQMERKSMLAELSKANVIALYTDDNNVNMPGVENRGLADYWNVTPKIFKNSRINLNLTLRNIRTGIPLRIWDILAAGGFCITNYQPELEMYFENGKDLVYFDSKKDLAAKVKYYLEHEDERREIAISGYNKVKKTHTYQHRFDEMQQIIPWI